MGRYCYVGKQVIMLENENGRLCGKWAVLTARTGARSSSLVRNHDVVVSCRGF